MSNKGRGLPIKPGGSIVIPGHCLLHAFGNYGGVEFSEWAWFAKADGRELSDSPLDLKRLDPM